MAGKPAENRLSKRNHGNIKKGCCVEDPCDWCCVGDFARGRFLRPFARSACAERTDRDPRTDLGLERHAGDIAQFTASATDSDASGHHRLRSLWRTIGRHHRSGSGDIFMGHDRCGDRHLSLHRDRDRLDRRIGHTANVIDQGQCRGASQLDAGHRRYGDYDRRHDRYRRRDRLDDRRQPAQSEC